MRKWRLTLTILAAATLLAAAARAQSGGGYDLSWWTIDGGGITFATGGTFNLGGTSVSPTPAMRSQAGRSASQAASGLRPLVSPITAMWMPTAVLTMRTYLPCCLRLATRAAVWVVWTPIAMGL
jgi:hypothetical protein